MRPSTVRALALLLVTGSLAATAGAVRVRALAPGGPASVLGLAPSPITLGRGSLALAIRDKSGAAPALGLRLPAALLDAGLALAPRDLSHEIAREAKPVLPAFAAAGDALAETDDGVLVEITDGDESVTIEKIDSSLVISVEDSDVAVRVAVPADTLGRLLRRLARAGDGDRAAAAPRAQPRRAVSGAL